MQWTRRLGLTRCILRQSGYVIFSLNSREDVFHNDYVTGRADIMYATLRFFFRPTLTTLSFMRTVTKAVSKGYSK